MPTYQYACTEPACGRHFDAVQSFSDAPLTACPRCEGRVRKVFSAVGVVFKGSGFYRTDSRKDSRAAADGTAKKKAAASSGESASSSSSSSTSSSGSTSAGGSSSTAPSSTTAAAS